MARNRWVILLALFLVRTSLGFQFQSIGSVAPFLVQDLGIDFGAIGTLIGFYMLPGLMLALPSGFLGRFISDRALVGAGLALMIAGGVFVGMADGFALAATGRLLAGGGAVLAIIFLAKMVTDWFAGREIVTAMSVLVSSWPLGIALGQITQGAIAQAHGWPLVMHLTALGAAAALLLLLLVYAEPPAGAKTATETWRLRLSRRELALVSLAALVWTGLNTAYIAYLSFTPLLLTARGMGLVESAAVVSLGSWVMILSIPLGGHAAARLGRTDAALVFGCLAGAAAMALLPIVPLPLPLCLIVGLLGAMPAGIIMALPAEVLSQENRAPGMGIFFSWFYAGMALAPIAAGWLLDATGDPAAPVLFGAALFAATAAMHGLFRLAQRRARPAAGAAAPV